jgi:flagellar protein FlaF
VRYQQASEQFASARDTELAAFAAVTRALEEDAPGMPRVRALGRNHALWSTLIKALAMDSNPLPQALKGQLIDLAAWSMRYSTLAILHPLPVGPLIDVNRNIAEGLAAQVRGGAMAAADAVPKAVSA